MNIQGSNAKELFDDIRQQVALGQIAPGQALPPVRELAQTLGLNRNTVALAYKRLVSAGVADAQGRRGTRIRESIHQLAREGHGVSSVLQDLASGNPSAQLLPSPAQLIQGVRGSVQSLYGVDPLMPELRAVCRQVFHKDTPVNTAYHVSYGAVDAIERLLQAFLLAGDRVGIEDPGYLSSINSVRTLGLKPVGIAVDPEGMVPQSLEQALAAGVRALILTPRAHNPTGCALSRARARQIEHILANYPEVLLMVDDHFWMLANSPYRNVIPAGHLRWALIRSVSKGLGPDLRVALMASDQQTAERLSQRLASGAQWVSHLLQQMVVHGLTDATLTAQTRAAQAAYVQARLQLMQALKKHRITFWDSEDGFNLWVPLDRDAEPVLAGLAARGWLARSGQVFGVDQPAQGLRLTFASLGADQAQRFAADLAQVLGQAQ
ncbi:MAG TPA: aminotransferase class I/II-fold pyridoxal phosphate-dependent enzyme [Alcaligenes sp.]|nr:aminotransferase class I/II-fold pyridoxal phosphate-dependent enzyme [Alcaligenes sp.]HRL27363.1 aminotransferase class I/II-fold pyridoxal phosphate-dependent enzyme [Alcaligenes sp.]